jgi:hypothetical protein
VVDPPEAATGEQAIGLADQLAVRVVDQLDRVVVFVGHRARLYSAIVVENNRASAA